MALGTEKIAETFLNIVANTPINCDWPLYAEDEVVVVYGSQALEAILNTDYEITLDGPNYDTFILTPKPALLTKINDLISTPPTDTAEINYITVRRVLDYKTSVTPEIVRGVDFLSREIERVHMRFQQIAEAVYRGLGLRPKEVGDPDVKYYVDPPVANSVTVWQDDGAGNLVLTNGPTVDEVSNAQGYAEDASDSADEAATQAGISTAQAVIATAQAGIATTQAGIATTQAGIATTQAGIATTQAGNASTSASTATTQAGIATTQAGNSATSASNAATSETNAATSATNSANSAISAAGYAVSNRWVFDNATAMADPGSGDIRLNNAALASVTQIAIAETNADGAALGAWINSFDDATAANRGYLTIRKNATNFAIYSITGALTDNGTWDTLVVTHISSAGSFTNGDSLYIGFSQSGNNGAGTGDASTNTATSVDSEIALFSGTGGKTLKRATQTGFLKGTSGVISAQTSIALTDLAAQAANTIVANATASSAAPTAFAVNASSVVGRGSSGNLANLTAGSGISIGASSISATGSTKVNSTAYTTNTTYSTTIPGDDTIPQNTEGTEMFNVAYTPTNASSTILILWTIWGGVAGGTTQFLCGALFKDSTANAVQAVGTLSAGGGGSLIEWSGQYSESAGSTSLRNYKLRAGASASSIYPNGVGGASRYYGGVGQCRFTIIEILP